MTQFDEAPIYRQRPIASHRPVKKSIKLRDLLLKNLIRERRRISLVYLRSHSENDQHQLQDLDRQLADYGIDIPAIYRALARDPAPQTGERHHNC
ncbi:hypothetical protein Thiowin_03207 [Thiorhodovibrio winogradskyi]|uniref:Uncharacterized protein n=1 Tax=Thiorhodovibrio winogradskyi TaxID=77007 RepID=A0ABZ0SCU9_9GAMM|nr:hypothetical protein [Thiorhodovibrio winogradskyi]